MKLKIRKIEKIDRSHDSIIPFLNPWSGSVSEYPAHTDGGGKNLKNILHVVNAHFTT